MKIVSKTLLVADDIDNQITDKLDYNQLFASSFSASFSDIQATGTFKLQGSNDPCPFGYFPDEFIPINWVDIANASANVTSGTSKILTLSNSAFRWVRALWTNTATGAQTITTRADESLPEITQITAKSESGGAPEVTDVTFVADVSGSLNSTYWLIWSGGDVNAYYVWYNVNSSGVDPALPGKIGIEVEIATDATDQEVADATAAAVTAEASADFDVLDFMGEPKYEFVALFNDFTTESEDGADPTGFTFEQIQAGEPLVSLNSTYFLINSAHDENEYYIWLDLDDTGVDPMVPGRTGIEVDISVSDTPGQVAQAIVDAINLAAASDFTAVVTDALLGIFTIENNVNGIATDSADGNTTFDIEILQQGEDDLNSLYFFINASTADGAEEFYVWLNVDSQGVDPMVPAKTGIEVAIAGGSTDAQVATAIAAELDSLAAFVSTATLAVITVTNATAGPFVPAEDFNTDFTFAVTAGGTGQITINLFAQGL